MLDPLGITGAQAADVVLSALGIYAAFLLLVRVFGARVLARMSTFDLLVTLMLGSIAGRVVLGETPVLAAGVLGLGTILVLEVVVGQLRTIPSVQRLLMAAPILIIRDGLVLEEGLRRAHLTPAEVTGALRERGYGRVDDVAYGIFEPTGAISLLRTGTEIDPAVLDGVVSPSGRLKPWHRH